MSGNKQAKVVVGVEGADEVGRAARIATDPWEEAGKRIAGSFHAIGNAATVALTSAAKDFAGLIAASGALNLSGVRAQFVALSDETSRFAVATGQNIGTVGKQFDQLGKEINRRPQDVVAFSTSLGQLTYDLTGAAKATKGLSDMAVTLDRPLAAMEPLGKTLHDGLSVIGDTSDALGKLYAQSELLKNAGGPAAFADQIQKMDVAFLSMQGTKDRKTALIGAIGAGAARPIQESLQQKLVNTITSNPQEIGYRLNRSIINEKTGEIDVEGAARAMQASLLSLGRQRAMFVMEKSGYTSMESAAFLNSDLSPKHIGKLEADTSSAMPHTNAETLKASPAGQRTANEIEANQKKMADVGDKSFVGDLITKVQQAAAAHPIGTGVAKYGADALLSSLTSYLTWSKIIRPALQGTVATAGQGASTSATALGAGGKALTAAEMAANAAGAESMAAKAAGAGQYTIKGAQFFHDALSLANKGRLATYGAKGLGVLGTLGRIVDRANPITTAVQAFVEPFMRVMPDIGQNREEMGAEKREEWKETVHGLRASQAKQIVGAAVRSGGTREGYNAAIGSDLQASIARDQMLQQIWRGMETGRINEAKLSADVAAALKEALRGTPLEVSVTITNATDHSLNAVKNASVGKPGQ